MPKVTKRSLRRQGKRDSQPAVQSGSRWIDAVGAPVDTQTFIFAAQAYQAAASMSMPTENPETKRIQIEDKILSFADTPLNRGMSAATKELREMGVDRPQAYLWRLMHLGDILEAIERFGPMMKSGEGGTFLISDAVFHAAATAKMVRDGDRTGFDIDDAVVLAQQYALEHSDAAEA